MARFFERGGDMADGLTNQLSESSRVNQEFWRKVYAAYNPDTPVAQSVNAMSGFRDALGLSGAGSSLGTDSLRKSAFGLGELDLGEAAARRAREYDIAARQKQQGLKQGSFNKNLDRFSSKSVNDFNRARRIDSVDEGIGDMYLRGMAAKQRLRKSLEAQKDYYDQSTGDAILKGVIGAGTSFAGNQLGNMFSGADDENERANNEADAYLDSLLASNPTGPTVLRDGEINPYGMSIPKNKKSKWEDFF